MLHHDIVFLYNWIIIISGIFFLFLSLTNILYLTFFTKKPSITEGYKVSVLVPARNEEKNISNCLDSLLNQTYRDYEIIVYDDMSEDKTWDIINEYSKKHKNIKVIKGEALPKNWYGKPHAMQTLAEYASGDFLLFTDADTIHEKTSISWAVTNAIYYKADVISGYTRQITRSLGEVAVVSNIFLNAVLFLPLWLIPKINLPFISHIIGQFIMFKANVFKEIGGYTKLSYTISEDIYMGRLLKKYGYKLLFLDAQEHVSCRMYDSFTSAVLVISKNIYDFFEKHVLSIILLTIFIISCLLFPVFAMLTQIIFNGNYFNISSYAVILFLAAWTFFLYNRKMPLYAPILYPFLFIILIFIAWKSVIDDIWGNGYIWKGRIVK